MKSTQLLGATCAALGLFASGVSAAVLVDYQMTQPGQPLNGNVWAAPTVTHENVIGTTLVNQSGAITTGSFNYLENRATSWSTAAGSSTNFANAFEAGSYVTFSITPEEGYQISLENISLRAAASTANTTSDRAFYLVTESSPAAFSSSSTVLLTDRTIGGTLPFQDANVASTVLGSYITGDLSTLGTISDTQYFRIYLQTPGQSQAISFDDIVVNGSVSVIPEPSAAAALTGAVFLGFAALRRRRR